MLLFRHARETHAKVGGTAVDFTEIMKVIENEREDQGENVQNSGKTGTGVRSRDVKVMTTVLQDMGNPFQNVSSDLLSLDTKNIANPSLAQLVAIHHQRGLKQVEVFLGGLRKDKGMSEITANRDSSSTSEYARESTRGRSNHL